MGMQKETAGDAEQAASPQAVPGYRQADQVVIITVEGEINNITELSIKRRISDAEQAGADAMVFEIDSPGGEVGAVLEISNAIKGSSIANTVAWVHPDAYSGGAIVALACRELLVSDPASMGDAFPITFGPGGVRGLTEDERTKFLPPLLSDVAESARRNGYDEYLVQAMVVDGIELWAVRDTQTGRWHFINENEYRTLFDGEPPRGKPLLTGVPEGRAADRERAAETPPAATEGDASESDAEEKLQQAEPDEAAAQAADEADEQAASSDAAAGEAEDGEAPAREKVEFKPASESVADLQEQISMGLETESQRPDFSQADRGRFVDPIYISDGSGPIVMRGDQLLRFGLAAAEVNSDKELKGFFGAKTMVRTGMNWSEHLVAFLTSMPVRGLLIVVFLLSLFLEMTSPGLMAPGAVAIVALAGLLAPPALIGMAGWWELAAIVGGVVLIIIEVFILPGFGLFGVAGLIALFVGLIGTFIPDAAGPLAPAGSDQRLIAAVATVALAVVTAGIGMFFVARYFGEIPILSRLVLQEPAPSESTDASAVASAAARPPEPRPGDTGETMTPLRPSGRVSVNGRPFDAMAQRGYIESARPVELVEKRGFNWIVRESAGAETGQENDQGDAARGG